MKTLSKLMIAALASTSAVMMSATSLASTGVLAPDCWIELEQDNNAQILSGFATGIVGAHYEVTTRTRGSGQVMDSQHTGPIQADSEVRVFAIALTGSVPGVHRGETAAMPETSRFMRSLERRVARANATGRPYSRISADMLIRDEAGDVICQARLR